MLRYGIGALLIILIITITLSYQYNAEGFAVVTAGTAAAKVAAAKTAADATNSIPLANALSEDNIVKAPSTKELAVANRKIATADRRAPSSNDKSNNTENNRKIDKISVKTEYKGDFLRIFAYGSGLIDPEAQKYWIIGMNAQDPPIWETVTVSNDENFESAIIPPEYYMPYINKVVYLVPKGSNNYRDAVTSFLVPKPSSPTIVNPKVSVSDTGYDAMKLNKQSNLLNDIQKIIHNEMLANRSLDVIVKNPNNRGVGGQAATGQATGQATGAAGMSAKDIAQLPPNMRAKARKQMQKNSCNGSCGGTCNSCQSDNDPDMSKYIRKDQIPCYGCSLDY
jgi:hypothetical protein